MIFKVIDAKQVYQSINPVTAVSKSTNNGPYVNVRAKKDDKKKFEGDFKSVFDKEVAKLK